MTSTAPLRTISVPPIKPVHHLPDDMLIDYASGSLDEATALFVTAHLTLCPVCCAHQAELEALGGALLEQVEPAPLSENALSDALGALDALNSMEEAACVTPVANDNPAASMPFLPSPVRHYFQRQSGSLTWKKLGMGIEKTEVAVKTPGKRAFLMKVPAGKTIPPHTHDGTEMVLVLQGAFQVDGRRFGPGDLSICDERVTHSPSTEPAEDCYCLVVVDGRIRLTGFLGSILNLFVKL